MTLQVFSARVSYRGADRFDVTRKSGCLTGKLFAPSWAILSPAIAARGRAWGLVAEIDTPDTRETATRIKNDAWDAYVPAFIDEMRQSYRANRVAWDWLLAKETTTLVCYCVNGERCHRKLLREILVKLGAADGGERGAT